MMMLFVVCGDISECGICHLNRHTPRMSLHSCTLGASLIIQRDIQLCGLRQQNITPVVVGLAPRETSIPSLQ